MREARCASSTKTSVRAPRGSASARRTASRSRWRSEAQRVVMARVAAHVTDRQRLRLALEARKERHVTGELLRVLRREAGAAIHAGEIVDGIDAVGLDARADESPRVERLGDLLIGPAQDGPAGVADGGIERAAEPVSCGCHGSL